MQTPALQDVDVALKLEQLLSQAPQCFRLVATSSHCPLHNVNPEGHEHFPPEHEVPPLHGIPQSPQLLSLLRISVHVPPQSF